jgi:membrane protein
VQPAGESSAKARHRARVSRRATRRRGGRSYRAIAWKLIKDTTNTCIEYRVTGLAAEVAFFTLMSVPPLLLCLAGTLGYLSQGVIDKLEADILRAAGTFLTPASVHQTVTPLLNSVFSGGRPDLISIGFVLALWSGSRALYVFVDSVTIMYGLEDQRGIVHTRLLSLGLYIVALVAGTVIGPLVIAGPDTLVRWFPATTDLVHALYWPGAILLSVCFMTTLYHVAVPVRTAWKEDVPGAMVALVVFFVCSIFLRLYLVHSVEGPTVYSSLAAPVAVLLWLGVTALAVLIGAAMNAAIDRMWPTRETAQARAANEKAREEAALEVIRRAEARRTAVRNRAANPPRPEHEGEPEAPAEYPERWADFLAPENVRGRIQSKGRRRGRYPSPFDRPAARDEPGEEGQGARPPR